MISSDTIRGYNDTIILHLLREGDSYGYQIAKEIERRSGGLYPIKETTLYSTFTRLEKQGFLVSYFGEESFGRRRTYYRVTDRGIAYYEEKCREWTQTKQVINQFTVNSEEENSNGQN